MIARLLATAALCALATTATAETRFSVQKSISMDQWVHWPPVERWNDDDVVSNFPEWRAFVSDDELRYLKQSGLDTVRLPVDPGFILYNGDIVRTLKIYAGIDNAVKRLRAAGLKVIVDMHTIPRGDGGAAGTRAILENPNLFAAYNEVLKTIAVRLREFDPSHVALEVINEPEADCKDPNSQAKWADQLETLHRTARQANAEITLVLTGACLGSAEGLTQMNPARFNDPNTLWSFHHYQPFKLTHQSATWAGPWVEHIANIPYPPTQLSQTETLALIDENTSRIFAALSAVEATKIAAGTSYDIERLRQQSELQEEMQGPMNMVADWAAKHAIEPSRILMGEFGMIRQEWERPAATQPEWRVNYMRDMTALAEQKGFAWSMWSFGGAFGMVQGFSGEALENPLIDDVLR
ncbi:MAG: cellulase family glycosylhydrolase [Ahrensia sp.]